MYRTRRFYVYSFPESYTQLLDLHDTDTILDAAQAEAFSEAVDDVHACEWFPPLDAPLMVKQSNKLAGFLVQLRPLPGRNARVYAALSPQPALLDFLDGCPS